MQKTKALIWLFPETIRRVEKQSDSGLGGWMLRKFHGEALKPDHILAFCQASFRMTLSRAGFRMLAPGILVCWMIFLCTCSSVSSVSSVLSGYSFTGIPQNFWFAFWWHVFYSFIKSSLLFHGIVEQWKVAHGKWKVTPGLLSWSCSLLWIIIIHYLIS